MSSSKYNFIQQNILSNENLKYDLPAGVAVFFVAVPLCLGIAHASGAPLISGLISGVIGGIVVGMLSNSSLSVSGPAAGLTAIVLAGIAKLGSFEAFLLATFLAGVIQIMLGLLRTGAVADYIPTTVIKGMLSAIGLILIIKQFPHMIGYDVEEMGVEEFTLTSQDVNDNYTQSSANEHNSFTVFINSLDNLNMGVMVIGLFSLFFLIVWDQFFQKRYRTIPGSLLVVMLGVLLNSSLDIITGGRLLQQHHLVHIPAIQSISEFLYASHFPILHDLTNYKVYLTAFTIAIVASIETLLSVEAIDKLDPLKRKTPANRELVAQGIGNVLCGLLGGLPMTAVIVRGSVNVSAGARTKQSAIFHGFLIIVAVVFFASLINKIPLASLAAVLIYTGYKLLNPAQLIHMYKKGWNQVAPFILSMTAIVLTDLLMGVMIGLIISAIFIVKEDYKGTILKVIDMGRRKRIILGENITFLHRHRFIEFLSEVKPGTIVEIDGSKNYFVDDDILELLEEFKVTARQNNIELIIGGLKHMESNKEELKKSMEESYERLFKNNEKWVTDKLKLNPTYFTNLAKGQTPQYLFIGCSDSRVPANEITGTEPGEMFVQRNIANMVVHTDVNLMSVLQYSVEVLNVKHVIVCGHYGCGGVKAAMDETAHGLIDKWLRNIKDVYRLHKDEIDAIKEPELQHRKIVELNVKEQVYNLMKTSFIQKNRVLYGFPEVHGWVYDINDGKLIDLKVDVEKDFPEFKEVYKIY
ncbi:MAG: SulP family inorganic anion transporter [Bacteroidota bacterium]|jgi:carbonic anhydrase